MEREHFAKFIKLLHSKGLLQCRQNGTIFQLFTQQTIDNKRLTVLLCTNADGNEKLTPFVIGTAKKPCSFKNVKCLPTDYTSNKKAWITQLLFEDFLRKLDLKMRLQKQKIILFIGNCTCHSDLKLKNVRVEFFRANCTSQLWI